ncbi:MAG TPA: agmatinase family protein [Fluviicola sp.]|nr:agmatinase family protein [Fluviicola sp.]
MADSFDPNGVGIANGNIFGFPVEEANADIVIIPVPWDATASYGKGTSDGPQAILDASTQLDFYHPQLPEAWKSQVFMTPISAEWKQINADLCVQAIEYIGFLEQGGQLTDDSPYKTVVDEINAAQLALKENLKERCATLLKEGKTIAVLGGEHSTPLGLIEALDDLGKPFGILQIDAHADLRVAYEDFTQSHASIMYNVVNNCKNLEKLVQVGIRDVAHSEVQLIAGSSVIETHFDWDIKRRQFEGETWKSIVDGIIRSLPQRVYISFDIDGLHPSLCPNTGTPVVGGFELEQINYLFFQLVEAGKQIIGFDLNEVAPGTGDDWDANVGARALWNLVCATEKSRKINY